MVPALVPAATAAAIRGPHVVVGRNPSADGWRGRPSVILGRKLSAIRGVTARVLLLRAHARRSWLAPRGHFRRSRPSLNSASAIKAGAGNNSGPTAGVIAVHVMYDARVDVVVDAVVEEVAGMPVAALVA